MASSAIVPTSRMRNSAPTSSSSTARPGCSTKLLPRRPNSFFFPKIEVVLLLLVIEKLGLGFGWFFSSSLESVGNRWEVKDNGSGGGGVVQADARHHQIVPHGPPSSPLLDARLRLYLLIIYT